MQLADFDFNLPEALIAQHPPAVRGSSRLLAALPDAPMADKMFADLPDWVQPGDVLVSQQTQVLDFGFNWRDESKPLEKSLDAPDGVGGFHSGDIHRT